MKTIFYNHMQVFTYIVGHLYHAKQTYLMYFHIEVKALKKKGGAPFTSIQVFTPNVCMYTCIHSITKIRTSIRSPGLEISH